MRRLKQVAGRITSLGTAIAVGALMLAGLIASPAMAQDKAKDTRATALDAKAVKTLVANRVWQVTRPRGPGYDYWSWNSDGSVCLRLGEKSGKCADTGRWRLEGERFCYELTWWGESYGLKSSCFRISDQGRGRYGWLSDNELITYEFSVVK
jgi:hypothetical protein